MHFKEVKDMLTQVWDIDRILYEQQLARRWERPDIDLDKLDYTKQKLPLKSKPSSSFGRSKNRPSSDNPNANKKINQRQLNDILQKISDRAGFLVEERLLQILKPYTDEDKCLVRIENIFSVSTPMNHESKEII